MLPQVTSPEGSAANTDKADSRRTEITLKSILELGLDYPSHRYARLARQPTPLYLQTALRCTHVRMHVSASNGSLLGRSPRRILVAYGSKAREGGRWHIFAAKRDQMHGCRDIISLEMIGHPCGYWKNDADIMTRLLMALTRNRCSLTWRFEGRRCLRVSEVAMEPL